MQTLIALILLLRLGSAHAADWYVTQSGAGAANGTSAGNAWPVTAFNASTAPTGGDTVHVAGTITTTIAPGTSGTGNGAGRLTLDCSTATLTAATGIAINGRNYLDLNGGTLGASASGVGIQFGGQSHDVTIQGWTQVNGDTSTSVFILCTYCFNLVVTGNSLTNSQSLIIGDSILNHDITIADNVVLTSHNTSEQTDIVFLGDAYGVTIAGNKLVQRAAGATSVRHNDCIQCYKKGGGNAGNPYGWIIRHNWIELDVRSGSGDTSWFMMENMANSGGVDACRIYGNVLLGAATDSASNNGACFSLAEPSAVFRFHNNTIIRKNGPDNTIRFLGSGTLHAENNLGYAASAGGGTCLAWTMAAGTWDYNHFANFNASAIYTGAHGGTAIPLFVDFANNDFSLPPGSPLRGAGTSAIGGEYDQGLAPNATWPHPMLVTRTSWDVGAYAHNPAANTPPTIATIPDQAMSVNSVKTVTLAVGDAQTAAGSLTVTATSANATLVSNSHLVVTGTGGTRTLTITPTAGQTGSATITVTVVDGGGLTASDAFVLTVAGDTTAPATPAAPTVSGNGGSAPVLSGTTEAGATVTIRADGVVVATVTAGANGAWTWTVGGLAAGSHAITVSASDAAGNASAASPATTITVGGNGGGGSGSASGAGGGGCGLGSGLAALLALAFTTVWSWPRLGTMVWHTR